MNKNLISDMVFDRMLNEVFLSVSANLVYKVVCKSACTSLKNWLHLVGIYFQQDKACTNKDFACISGEGAPDTQMRYDTEYMRLNVEDAKKVLFDDRYIKFTMVRNPYRRLFSMWADKILGDVLAANCIYFVDSAFIYKPIINIDDARNSIEFFLTHLMENKNDSLLDRHYAPQSFIVRKDLVKYTVVGKLEQKDFLFDTLSNVLSAKLPSFPDKIANEGTLKYHHDFFTDKSIQMIKNLYGPDFDDFSYDPCAIPLGKYNLDNSNLQDVFLSYIEKRLKGLNEYRYAVVARHLRKAEYDKVSSFERKKKKFLNSLNKRIKFARQLFGDRSWGRDRR